MTNTTTITIEVSTVPGNTGQYRTTLNGETVTTSKVPFHTSARKLLAAGHPADALLQMKWVGKSFVSLSGILGEAAKLTVTEEDRDGLKVVPHRALLEPFRSNPQTKGCHGFVSLP